VTTVQPSEPDDKSVVVDVPSRGASPREIALYAVERAASCDLKPIQIAVQVGQELGLDLLEVCRELRKLTGEGTSATGASPQDDSEDFANTEKSVVRSDNSRFEDSEHSEKTIDGWSPPIPFGFQGQLPPFPLEVLPTWLRNMVANLAMFTQTPPDVGAMVVLSVVGTVLAKRVIVRVRDQWVEPVNVYTVTALSSGERKSPVFRVLARPVEKLEKQLRGGAAPIIRGAEARKKAVEADAKAAQKDADDASPLTREDMLKKAVDARARADALTVPPWPRLLADDITQEKAASFLAEQNGRMSILSDEGGVFEILAGRYSDGRPNIDVYLKGWSGEVIRVDRIGRPSEYVENAAITIGLTVQPDVVRGLARTRGFRGRGLIARFWFSLPASLVGARDIEPPSIPNGVVEEYEKNVLSLATRMSEWIDEPRGLSLSEEAWRLLVAFQKQLEPDLAPTGRLGHLADWGGKLAGAAVRIAGLLHVASHATDSPPGEIGGETMEAALAIADYLVPHALAAIDLMGCDQVVDDARRVLDWLRDRHIEKFSAREAFQVLKGSFKKMTRLNEALQLLVDHQYIGESQRSKKRGAGRPPSPIFLVSPWVHSS
jgi:replicative DNA helicase